MSKLNIGKDLYLKGRIGWQGLRKDEYLTDGDYKIINATALMDGYVDWENCGYITKERFEEAKDIQLKENDILISKDGTLGKIGYVKNLTTPCSVASGVFVLRNTKPELIDFDYLYHILKSHIFKDFINRNKALGSTISHLYQRDLNNFELELPSLEEQKQVAKVLNDIDFKIDNNNKIIFELKSMAKTIYDYWFLQFEFPNEGGKPYKSSGGKMVWNEELKRKIPEAWEVFLVKDFCDIFTGKKDVNQALDTGKYKFFSCAPGYKYSNDKLYTGKAILISGNGSYTGRTIFVNDSFDLYQRTYACVMKPNSKNMLEYIFYTLKTFFVKRVSGGTHGSAIPYIVYNDIANESIYYNKEVIERFMEIVVPIQEQIVDLSNENENLISLRDFLLPMLMNGQVTIKEKA